MNNITFEQRLLNILGKDNDDDMVKEFVKDIDEKPEIGIEEFGLPDDRLYYEFSNHGLALMFNKKGRLTTIYVYIIESEEFNCFSENYNEFIKQGCDKVTIINNLGKPSDENNEEYFYFGYLTPKWIVYDYKDYTIHFTFYGARDRLAKITIMTPDVAPGRKKVA